MKQLCEQCEKRPARLFRRPHKYRGRSKKIIIKSDKHHAMCRQCWSAMHESIRQRAKEA